MHQNSSLCFWRALIKFYCFFEQHKSNNVPVHNHENVEEISENLVSLRNEKKNKRFLGVKLLNVHLLKKSDASVDSSRNTTANFTIFLSLILHHIVFSATFEC